MSNVVMGYKQSTFPKKLAIVSGIILLAFVILPFMVGSFQLSLMSKLLLFWRTGCFARLGLGLYGHF